MANITKHAKRRAKERAGISKGNVKKMAAKILNEGITHKECKGDLEKWVTARYFYNKRANNIRLYGDQCYIFCGETLITVLPIPENLKPEVARLRRLHKKKYRFDKNDTISCGWYTLYRIVAEKDFGDVSEGDRGGYIMRMTNLSQEGESWVYDRACVFADAVVADNAKVKGRLWISGKAEVSGNAVVNGKGRVGGRAVVTDDVVLEGQIQIGKDAVVNGNGYFEGNFILQSGICTLGSPNACTSLAVAAPPMDTGQWLMMIGACRNEAEAEALCRWLQA